MPIQFNSTQHMPTPRLPTSRSRSLFPRSSHPRHHLPAKPPTSRTRKMTSTHHFTLSSTYNLQSSHSIPTLGYGVYQTPASVVESVVSHAFQSGYRHVDSARAYRNEGGCAEAIRASRLKRGEVFFTSKVPPKEMGYGRAKVGSSFLSTFPMRRV